MHAPVSIQKAAGPRLTLAVSLIGTVTLWACGGKDTVGPGPGTGNGTVTVVSVVVTPSTATLVSVGEKVQLTASAQDANSSTISGKTFTWTSSNTPVATVDATGLVTVASGDGTATITATADGVSGTAVLTVSLAVASIDVTPATGVTSLALTLQFSATANDANGNPISGESFSWTSSDLAVATISAVGLATPQGIGTTTITASGSGAQGVGTLKVVVTASLTFSGDATFQGEHATHPIAVAVVRVGTGVVALDNGTVSGTADPSFSFSFPGILLVGETYEVHYWIDSNFVGGTVGVCNTTAYDHQWNVAVPAVTGPDVAITELHNVATVTDVCASF